MQYHYDDEVNEYTDSGYKPPEYPDVQREDPYEQDNYIDRASVVPLTKAPADISNNAQGIPVTPADHNTVDPAAQTTMPDYAAIYAQAASPVTQPVDPDSRPHTVRDSIPGYVQYGAQNSSFVAPPPGWNNRPQSAQDAGRRYVPGNTPVYSPDNASHQQRMFAFRGYYQQGQPNYTPQDEGWREPVYSQTHESVSNMYSPGICVAQPYPHKRADVAQPERKHKEHGGFPGKILRAACLVIICAAVSGLAAYAVTEGWFGLGSKRTSTANETPPIVNQVVLGNNSSGAQRNDNLTTIVPNGVGMPVEQIYMMACEQVVGIKIELPASAGRFGDVYGEQSAAAVSGSGFIISNDGYILTNYHVIEAAHENNLPLVVSMHDGTEYNAKIIGYDKNYDVALIKIESSDLNAVLIADSNKVNVGQPVYAVGNPFGDLVYTMTEGIVSALDRVVTVDNKSISTFQFSAAVNSGNSGGPVYDANGEVIGIVSAKIMGTSVEGIGFAIPINDAIDIASKLIEDGYISGRPLMGITVNTVDPANAEYFSLVVGAHIRSTATGSAAEKAGLKVGDIITALGDAEIDSTETLLFAMRKFKAGETTTVKVWRAGQELSLSLTFDEDLSAGQPQRSQQDSQTLPERNDPTENPFVPNDQFIIPIPPSERSQVDPSLPD